MNNIALRNANPEDFPVIARLILEQNKNPVTHCIHSDVADQAESISQEMADLAQSGEIIVVIAIHDKEIVGVISCEFDPEVGRGWLRGPFVFIEPWTDLAAALLESLQTALPPAIRRLDSFLNRANERGNRFYLAQGFRQVDLVHVYQISRPEIPPPLPEMCRPASQAFELAIINLHDTLFPETYISGASILKQLDPNHQVFIYVQGDEGLGYIYTVIDHSTGEGYIEFLGARADARRQGIGRWLLQAALYWFFQVKRAPQASLTVFDNVINARSLYESAGFRLKYTGVNTRREW